MTGSPALHRRSQLGWGLLIACLAVETLLLAWVTLFTLLAALGSSAGAAQNYSLVVVAAICLVWVAVTLVASVRSRVSWVRGSAVTIHVLLFAAGTGCLQLAIGPWWVGFGIISLALVGFFAAILARPLLAPEASGESLGQAQPSSDTE